MDSANNFNFTGVVHTPPMLSTGETTLETSELHSKWVNYARNEWTTLETSETTLETSETTLETSEVVKGP